METVFPTITIAFIIFLIAFVFLGLGLIFTGKSRIQRGGCSKVPGKDGSCSPSSCSLCGRKEENDEEERKEPSKTPSQENK